jgi:large subunit ribosomal protein L17
MRHQKSDKKLGRTSPHRTALFNNLVTSLLTYGRIETTEAKAKMLRRFADQTITWGTRCTRCSPRREGHPGRARQDPPRPAPGASDGQDSGRATATVLEIGPHFATRKGGYTRILKTRVRKGDAAPMAVKSS